jgi:hypothetical protein
MTRASAAGQFFVHLQTLGVRGVGGAIKLRSGLGIGLVGGGGVTDATQRVTAHRVRVSAAE